MMDERLKGGECYHGFYIHNNDGDADDDDNDNDDDGKDDDNNDNDDDDGAIEDKRKSMTMLTMIATITLIIDKNTRDFGTVTGNSKLFSHSPVDPSCYGEVGLAHSDRGRALPDKSSRLDDWTESKTRNMAKTAGGESQVVGQGESPNESE
ncbi:hypothetical protein PoB_003567400 [Plakobranchus ocellatus]|uniref:Uncharacterized protein n=1 Tax=Plakobranchus ocellatus TaxID=259542 RepID=A0AAV4AMZ6_9GAST|nr:hypothetical protein PoB_003567400 [Plakobranchus ocellatus]